MISSRSIHFTFQFRNFLSFLSFLESTTPTTTSDDPLIAMSHSFHAITGNSGCPYRQGHTFRLSLYLKFLFWQLWTKRWYHMDSRHASSHGCFAILAKARPYSIAVGWTRPQETKMITRYLSDVSERKQVIPNPRQLSRSHDGWNQEFCPECVFNLLWFGSVKFV